MKHSKRELRFVGDADERVLVPLDASTHTCAHDACRNGVDGIGETETDEEREALS